MMKRILRAGMMAAALAAAPFFVGTTMADSHGNDEKPKSHSGSESHMSQGMMKKHHGDMMPKGPTLKLEKDGKGREIEFECHATMDECLKALDHVTESME